MFVPRLIVVGEQADDSSIANTGLKLLQGEVAN